MPLWLRREQAARNLSSRAHCCSSGARRSRSCENRRIQRTRAIRERLLVDRKSAQDAQIHVGHPRLALPTPVTPVLEAHIASSREQRWEIVGVVRGARAAAEQDDAVVQHASLSILVPTELFKEMRELPA